jgi:hypothetical protein
MITDQIQKVVIDNSRPDALCFMHQQREQKPVEGRPHQAEVVDVEVEACRDGDAVLQPK